jgi:hypothetical protein
MSNYNYHGTRDLIVLPGRSVQTFPSGLVRVDRTYACRAEDANRFRQQFAVGNPLPFDDGSPAIDGAFIFPNATEESSDDGFYRFNVSGYGRTSAVGTYTPLNAAEARAEAAQGARWLIWSARDFLIQNVCLIRSSPLQKISVDVPGPSQRTGNIFTVELAFSGIFETWYETLIWQVLSTDVTYFGRIEETRIIWGYVPIYLDQSNFFWDGNQYNGTALV